MIGDESIVLLSPSSPTSTGHVFRFSHSSAAALNSPGGSISETNSPAATYRVVWVETNVCLSVLSLSSPLQGVVLVILAVTLKVPSCKRSARTSTAPRRGRPPRPTPPGRPARRPPRAGSAPPPPPPRGGAPATPQSPRALPGGFCQRFLVLPPAIS